MVFLSIEREKRKIYDEIPKHVKYANYSKWK